MKKFMSKKEYSKVRKHFKSLYENAGLTEQVLKSEEYLNFEKEEIKRQKAKAFVKDFVKNFDKNSVVIDLKKKTDTYSVKYMDLLIRKGKLEEELKDLFKNKKIDRETFDNFKKQGIMHFFTISFLDVAYTVPLNMTDIVFFESYIGMIEEDLSKLRFGVVYLSNMLIKAEKELEDIKKRQPELMEKRKKEDAELIKEKEEKVAGVISKEKTIEKLEHRVKEKSLELERNFLDYIHSKRDTKSR